MLLPPECVELQPIEVSKLCNKPQLTKPEEDTITTRNKSAVAKYKRPGKETEELRRSYAAELHAEPKKVLTKMKN